MARGSRRGSRRDVRTVWIDSVGDEFNVYDASGNVFDILTRDELLAKAMRENWHVIPLALVQAVNEFAAGGWELTRPPHCRPSRQNA